MVLSIRRSASAFGRGCDGSNHAQHADPSSALRLICIGEPRSAHFGNEGKAEAEYGTKDEGGSEHCGWRSPDVGELACARFSCV